MKGRIPGQKRRKDRLRPEGRGVLWGISTGNSTLRWYIFGRITQEKTSSQRKSLRQVDEAGPSWHGIAFIEGVILIQEILDPAFNLRPLPDSIRSFGIHSGLGTGYALSVRGTKPCGRWHICSKRLLAFFTSTATGRIFPPPHDGSRVSKILSISGL